MPNPKRSRLNQQQTATRLKQGWGDHKNPNYTPFIRIHDFSSLGRVSRIKYEGREIHTMSDLETTVLSELRWSDEVVAIYDQHALTHVESRPEGTRKKGERSTRLVTEGIAEEMGVKHPILRDGSPAVMTTDFFVEMTRGRFRAISVKPLAQVTRCNGVDVSDRRVRRILEKLELERRYWQKLNTRWLLVTDADVSKTRRMNIELLLSTQAPDVEGNEYVFVEQLAQTIDLVTGNKNRSLLDIARITTPKWGMPVNRFVEKVRLLCAHRLLEFDLNRPFSPTLQAGEFRLGTALLGALNQEEKQAEAA